MVAVYRCKSERLCRWAIEHGPHVSFLHAARVTTRLRSAGAYRLSHAHCLGASAVALLLHTLSIACSGGVQFLLV
jgi:hypothetical protein